jgi:cytosine/adenosine deaminase-related metal-dependent hydrolase/ubiquinone/menaquinone biosynthesis C-methylase UbiE
MATAITQRNAVQSAYRKWARDYDELPNPVTALESRVLSALTPNLRDRDVADLGCGTGRSFPMFEQRGAHSVVGIDFSAEMLTVANRKLRPSVRLIQGDVCDLPLHSASVDVTFASLLVSYVSDISRFAREVRRISRDNAIVMVSDLHPASVRKFAWKRIGSAATESVELPARVIEIEEIIRAFEHAGFVAEIKLEFPFGEAERPIFSNSGKQADFDRFANEPAIFVLQFRAAKSPTRAASELGVLNCNVVLDCETSVDIDLFLSDGKFQAIGFSARPQSAIDLSGMTVFPGLVNAHDHLEFALFPRLGNRLYGSANEWAASIHNEYSQTIERSRALDRQSRCEWGGLRNALAGVTSVNHHNPIHAGLESPDFPVRVTRNFSWSHSLSFDDSLQQRHRERVSGQPFILHAGEGFDDEARTEFENLLQLGVLGHSTVIVHGIAFQSNDFRALAESGCSLVWCPSSNYFLFGATHDRELIEQYPRVALGSDSPITAEGDLLDELRFANQIVGVSPQALFRQVTTAASDILCLSNGEGTIRPLARGDFFAVASDHSTPAERLATLSFRDIELVVNGGVVQVASTKMLDRLSPSMREGLAPLEIDGTVRWVRQSLGKLFARTEAALGCDFTMMGRKVRHVSSAWI